jgi:putative ABC transport system permease protein
MLGEIRYALRTLVASPAFTTAAVLTLALGIGANTAIFTAVYGVLLKPLPYGDPGSLVRISETRRGGAWNVSYPNYLDWRARNHVFQEMAIFNTYGRVIVGGDASRAAQLFPLGTCEIQMFRVMGIPAALGRLFTDDESAATAPGVAVVSDEVWRKRFGSDPSIVGETVRIDDDSMTIVGVLPPGVRPFDVDVWFPHRAALMTPMMKDRANHPGFGVVARLRPGVGVEQAQRELTSIAAALEAEYPASNSGFGVAMKPMIDAVAGQIRPTLRLLMAAVAVLLLIACANVANLLLAKGLRRERETSIRSALGASRFRLIRLFLIEGVTLGSAGAIGGLLLAGWGVRLLRSVPGLSLPRASDVAIDPHVLGFAAALAIATAVLFALAPAMQLSRVDLMRVLRQAGTGDPASPRTARLRSLLVAAEVALLIVLLSGAALMQRSLGRLAAVETGFDAERVLSVPLQQIQGRYGSEAAVLGFADRLLASVRRNPDVAGAALSWPFDYTGFTWAPNVNLPDHPFEPGREPVAQTAAVTPGYFAAMGIPLRRGRDFGRDEHLGAPTAAIVNETFARRFFPGEEAIGRRVSAMRIPEMQNMTIVGVVGDTRRGGMLMDFTPELYVPYAQFPQANATLVVRGRNVDPTLLSADLKARVAEADAGTAIATVRRVSEALARTYGDRRALSWLLAVFAVLALGLTVLGIASVVSFTVAQRVPEIGVRIALGANRRDVLRLIVRGSMYPVCAGAAAGLIALMPLSRLFRSYLFEVSPADPASLAASSAILVLAAIAAAYVPARRATAIDPLAALRSS